MTDDNSRNQSPDRSTPVRGAAGLETVNQDFERYVEVDGKVYMVPSRAISLTQPWPYFMLQWLPEYRKDIENRKPGFVSINFRGRVWVHAPLIATYVDWNKAHRVAVSVGVPELMIPTWDMVRDQSKLELRRGGIVGQFCIDSYLPPTATSQHKWHFPHHHGFQVSSPFPFDFVPCKGKLGFWRVPQETLEQLARQIHGHEIAGAGIALG